MSEIAHPSTWTDAGTAPAKRTPLRALVVWPLRALLAVVALVVVLGTLGMVGPRVLPYHVFPVVGGSMEPTIHLGSLAIVRPVDAAGLRVGDVVTFHPPANTDRFVTHRIVKVKADASGRYFVTKGDANAVPDGWVLPARGQGWRYSFSMPLLGYAFVVVQSPFGRFATLILVVAVLGVGALWRIWRAEPAEDA